MIKAQAWAMNAKSILKTLKVNIFFIIVCLFKHHVFSIIGTNCFVYYNGAFLRGYCLLSKNVVWSETTPCCVCKKSIRLLFNNDMTLKIIHLPTERSPRICKHNRYFIYIYIGIIHTHFIIKVGIMLISNTLLLLNDVFYYFFPIHMYKGLNNEWANRHVYKFDVFSFNAKCSKWKV